MATVVSTLFIVDEPIRTKVYEVLIELKDFKASESLDALKAALEDSKYLMGAES